VPQPRWNSADVGLVDSVARRGRLPHYPHPVRLGGPGFGLLSRSPLSGPSLSSGGRPPNRC